MTQSTPQSTTPAAHLRSGLIYESATTGSAFTRLDYDAVTNTVTILYGDGTATSLDGARLGDTLLHWAALCFECQHGRLPGMRLGPVGERLAHRYTAYVRRPAA